MYKLDKVYHLCNECRTLCEETSRKLYGHKVENDEHGEKCEYKIMLVKIKCPVCDVIYKCAIEERI